MKEALKIVKNKWIHLYKVEERWYRWKQKYKGKIINIKSWFFEETHKIAEINPENKRRPKQKSKK